MIFIERIDSVPLAADDFSYEYRAWVSVLVDSLNTTFEEIESDFNLLTAQSYTATEITDLFTDSKITDGIILYDSTNNVYVGMQSGALVQFTTTPYP